MRKNSPRKWLHACLDLLPVILIPVFMIYSHRHTIDSGSVEISQNLAIDFNQQLAPQNETISVDDITIIVDGYNYNIDGTNVNISSSSLYQFSLVGGHKYLARSSNEVAIFQLNYYLPSGEQDGARFSSSVIADNAIDGVASLYFIGIDLSYDNVNTYLNVFDLTQMFGEGNEPTIQQFNQWYTDDYYEYTISHRELLKNTSTITYSDTDIMSQFTYQLYNSVDKYFNMGNVFNMTSVYDWFNLNIFNGNAPISIYIVWNIVLYEFVMDLLFLLYGLFMWFIDMVEHIMDKPFKSIK